MTPQRMHALNVWFFYSIKLSFSVLGLGVCVFALLHVTLYSGFVKLYCHNFKKDCMVIRALVFRDLLTITINLAQSQKNALVIFLGDSSHSGVHVA